MAASLFTFSSTSRRVVPAQNSPPLPIHIKATNVAFNPDIPDVHRGLGLDEFVNFLVSCRLRYAISDVPSEFFPEQVCEFYYTATINEENNVISGTIGRGRHSVFITTDLLSAALRLPIFEPFSELPPIERCRCLFDQLGYDHSKAGTRSALILCQCMTPGWKFFTGALCKCVGHKSCSGDQLSTYEQQVVCSLFLKKRLDYGAFYFDKLVQLLRANDDPLETDIGISDRMREWIANPYTVPSLTADTDERADGNNEDHADQEAESQDGSHLSPQLSHHTLSVTERVHSAQEEPLIQGGQPSQGEPSSQGEQPSQGENPFQGDQPSPGAQPHSQEVPGTSFLHIPASAFN
uniref:Uncharacterized protein n=1 Tax=Lactuca sativa TaxID=4236 RepID=A0A9R1W6Z5_LACSA|nr:hypothetical protein LSAT_V11C300142170 [Lactuca sativa]